MEKFLVNERLFGVGLAHVDVIGLDLVKFAKPNICRAGRDKRDIDAHHGSGEGLTKGHNLHIVMPLHQVDKILVEIQQLRRVWLEVTDLCGWEEQELCRAVHLGHFGTHVRCAEEHDTLGVLHQIMVLFCLSLNKHFLGHQTAHGVADKNHRSLAHSTLAQFVQNIFAPIGQTSLETLVWATIAPLTNICIN
jgi:hypothetical protein